MYIEYCNYNKSIENYEKEKQDVFRAIETGIDGLAMPIHMIREMREFLPSHLIKSTAIDYPCGTSASKVRYHMVINSIKSGANCIDYVLNHYFLKNKFSELKKEMETVVNICKEYQATLRVFLDYNRSTNTHTIAEILNHDLGIDIFFPTLGYHHDDFFDNIINTKLLEQRTNCSIIFNGYTWKKEQVDFIKDINIFGMRIYNLELLV